MKGYKNSAYFFLIIVIIVIAGFYKSYYGLFPYFNKNTTLITHFHALVMSLWLILIVAQPLLIRYKYFSIHRLLGKISYILVPVIIFSFVAVTFKQYNEDLMLRLPLAEVREDIFVSIAKLILFTTFYLLAIVYKKTIALHMRYIIATALIFIEPSVSRIATFWMNKSFCKSEIMAFLITDFTLIIFIIYDKSKRLNTKAYIIVLVCFLLYHSLWYFGYKSD